MVTVTGWLGRLWMRRARVAEAGKKGSCVVLGCVALWGARTMSHLTFVRYGVSSAVRMILLYPSA